MRWMRTAVLAGLVFKAIVLGVWWWGSLARAEKPAPGGAAGGSPPEASVPPELLAKSRGFRDLLEAVRQRGAELDRREQAVAEREAALKALEATLGEQVGRSGAPVTSSPTPPAGAPAGPPVETAGACGVVVTKIYQSMKAEEAAPIFDRLDDGTAIAIFGCMKEKQIGAILAAMNRDRAVALTRALAGGS